jgi:hypothetical protein
MCSANVVVAEFSVSRFAGLEELASRDLLCRELQNWIALRSKTLESAITVPVPLDSYLCVTK